MSVIDIHCHTAGVGAGGSGCFISTRLRESWRYRFYLASFGVTDAELEREGDGLVLRRLAERLAVSTRVQAAVVLALDGAIDSRGNLDRTRTELFIPNDFLAGQCRRYPNLLFGASVNPLRPDALDRLDAAAADGAVLVKWLPSIQGTDPADRRLVPFYRRLAELGLPLLTHTGEEQSFTRADNSLSDPNRLRLPLDEGVTVIAAHCATSGRSEGQRNRHRLLALFAAYPNLHADISSLTQVNRLGHLQWVLKHRELHERLLYGTDMPLPATALTSPWFHLFSLGPFAARRLAAIRNPWDRDVALKLALGMPEQILHNAAGLLRLA
ncbi:MULTISPECIES: amidohydrolase family protein [Geobacter]|uniref:amidohydrolase family protein n=1 Tax=Geobacter TaxID=28231 RepID=UPI002574383C|nr:amidohydrolase family protein [Geobacter sulfurreducens]BEH11557.1 amidohydrolase family protein [Geobacter sulfurreducens subsp. ethanolicus]BET59413.1 amidohydrolase family protein [Geobacter sp. 60473]